MLRADDNFRYDPALGGTGTYIYNLSTKGYEMGAYDLSCKAGSDPTVHKARLQVG